MVAQVGSHSGSDGPPPAPSPPLALPPSLGAPPPEAPPAVAPPAAAPPAPTPPLGSPPLPSAPPLVVGLPPVASAPPDPGAPPDSAAAPPVGSAPPLPSPGVLSPQPMGENASRLRVSAVFRKARGFTKRRLAKLSSKSREGIAPFFSHSSCERSHGPLGEAGRVRSFAPGAAPGRRGEGGGDLCSALGHRLACPGGRGRP